LTEKLKDFARRAVDVGLSAIQHPPEPIKSSSLPRGPWQDLALDFLGPLLSGDFVLVVVD